MEDVPPGTYCLSAFIDVNGDERPDVLLEPYYIHGTDISVSPGQKIRNIVVEGFFNERDPSFKTAERTKEYCAFRDSAKAAVENAYQKLSVENDALLFELMPTLRAKVFEAEETWAIAGNEADWEHIKALLEPLPELASAAAEGIDRTSSLRGCLLRAYLSELDGTIQRYAMHVPEEYDGSRPFPLVIALHSSGGDHWSGLKLVTGYSNILRRADEANRHFFPKKLPSDFIVVSPNGYGFEGPGYRGPAEYDVMKVLEEVESHYKIDKNRIYLTGASKGGQGTWEIGLKHPELFAAIAPVCGATGGVRLMASQIGRVRIFVFHGAKDRITSVNESRIMIAAARRLGNAPQYRYFEYPEWGHFATFRVYENGAIFDLFRRESRPSV
jgi:poly(3-hydroxybutyrate) depolymerase